ncbi:MAG: response regulator [Alphaproteobacteria bacterium]|nr:response regulator [Alphaproteobacteria bacterium]
MAAVNGSGRFDLLVSDVVLTGPMSGFELAEWFYRRQSDIRVLFMSGYPRDDGSKAGAGGRRERMLQKPIARDELIRAVREELGHARG